MAAQTPARPGAVRIVGGVWRGRKIFVPERARPSANRAREALFNCLGQRLSGWRCLDLFAGSGALGFEAASRGAARVVFVDRCWRNVSTIRAAIDALQAPAQATRACALSFLRRCKEDFDLIFLDPPFADYAQDEAWRRLLTQAAARLPAGGRLYCESDRPLPPPPGWRAAAAARRAGRARWHIFCKP